MASRIRFLVNCKNFFLTYPRCNLSKEDALEKLQCIDTPTNKKYIKICKETHENGDPHLHVLIQFEGKFKCQNRRFFDLISPSTSLIFHPNIQGARSSSDVREYMNKEGDTLWWGEFQEDGRKNGRGQQSANDSYARALNAPDLVAATNVLRTEQPRDFLNNHHNIVRNLDIIFNPPHQLPPYVPPFQESSFTNVPEEMQEWADGYFGNTGEERPLRYKSIIIEGDSRTGKTMWARCFGKHNYISGHLDFNPRCFSNDAQYNVIDDIKPDYLKLKHWKELIGAQEYWQSNCKYSKPVQIKGGIPSIILCNPGEGYSYKQFLDDNENIGLQQWTIKNAVFIFLSEPLY